VGHLKIYDDRGYTYLPEVVREAVGAEGRDRIPFYMSANCVLLTRKNATLEELLKGLDILREELKLRAA